MDANADYSIGLGEYVSIVGLESIAIGDSATVDSNYSISIGANSSVAGLNSAAIGYQASVTADNEYYFGNSSVTSIGGVVNWTATSDGRFKNDVREDVSGLGFIERLRPVTYTMDLAAIEAFNGRSISPQLRKAAEEKGKIRYTGFIAQEVEQAAEDADFDFSGVDPPQDEDDAYGIRYAEFVVPLVKAVQELNEKVDSQEEIISAQKETIENYETALSQLTQRLNALEVQVKQNTVNTETASK